MLWPCISQVHKFFVYDLFSQLFEHLTTIKKVIYRSKLRLDQHLGFLDNWEENVAFVMTFANGLTLWSSQMRMINVGCLRELKDHIQYPKRVWHAVPSDAVCHSLYLWDTFDLQWLFCLHSNGQDVHQIVCKWAIIYVPEGQLSSYTRTNSFDIFATCFMLRSNF